jgi:gluconate 5-dehydrogenase
MRLNLDATFFLSQAVAKRSMIPRRSGKIVNIASVSGLAGNPPWLRTAAYSASKGAVVNLTRELATEWGRYNLNVNAICPGFFPSKMAQGIIDREGQAIRAATPLGRLGGEEDLKGAVVFLASEASRHVTGHCLVVDGGALVA